MSRIFEAKAPALSIIITAYEQPVSLSLLLLSLQGQRCDASFEVIICDDGSSRSALDTFHARTDLSQFDLLYVWQSKKGYRAARSKNNGIRCARAAVLLFLDADILLKPDFLQSHLAARIRSKQIVCNPRRWLLGTDSMPDTLPSSLATPASKIEELLSRYRAQPNDTSVFQQLNHLAEDFDRPPQQKDAVSKYPWMACVGFSFSVDNGPEVYFDEHFEGWGPEDRELALRLISRYNYSLSYQDEIQVFHLENYSTGRPRLCGLPTAHDQIVAFLRNIVYFQRLYGDDASSRIADVVLYYELDLGLNQWRLDPLSQIDLHLIDPGQIRLKLAFVKEWLYLNGMLSD